jgi:CDP-diacylglycerol--glycerol-3-phosphate 3-phosphatidyltransferase
LIKEQLDVNHEPTLTDQLRKLFQIPLSLIGNQLHVWGVSANMITVTGLVGTFIGSYLISSSKLLWGGAVILAMGILDAFDGAVARAAGTTSKFGSFIDSVADRYIEISIYAGLTWYFIGEGKPLGVLLSVFALSGSVLVSYTRSRAESLGIETKVGILTRVERMVVIGPAVIFQIPLLGVGLVAFLANFTAFQRIVHVYQQIKQLEGDLE